MKWQRLDKTAIGLGQPARLPELCGACRGFPTASGASGQPRDTLVWSERGFEAKVVRRDARGAERGLLYDVQPRGVLAKLFAGVRASRRSDRENTPRGGPS